jgi:hypothetical protein
MSINQLIERAFQPTIICLLYALCWVIHQRLNFKCQLFGTLFHLHRRVGMK